MKQHFMIGQHPRTRSFRSATLLATGVVGLALGLSACTSSPGKPTAASNSTSNTNHVASRSPGDAVLLAAQRGITDGTARFTMDISVSGSETANETVTGAADFADGTAQLSVSVPQLGAGGKITVIEAGGIVYENLASIPDFNKLDLDGKTWLEVPVKSALAESNQAEKLGNPEAFLQALTERGISVKEVGHSSIDGVNVTGYDVNFSGLISKSGQAAGASSSTRSLLRDAKMEVWIDATGLLRRLDLTGQPTSALGSPLVKLSMTLSDYGAPVQVSVPPQSEVVSLQAFLKAFGESGTGALSGLGSGGASTSSLDS
jgi:hypothetical protein